MWHRGLPNYQASNHLSPYSHLTKTKYPPSTQSLTSSLAWNHVVVHTKVSSGSSGRNSSWKMWGIYCLRQKTPFIVGKVKLRKEESRRSQVWTSWSGGTGLLKMITDPKLKTWKFWEWPTERFAYFCLRNRQLVAVLCAPQGFTHTFRCRPQTLKFGRPWNLLIAVPGCG